MKTSTRMLGVFVLSASVLSSGSLMAQLAANADVPEDQSFPQESSDRGAISDAEAEAAEAEASDATTPESVRMDDYKSIQNLVEQADMVFQSVVQDITYKLSDPTGPEGVQVPYTFVTFSVEDMIYGSHDGNEVTLRFIGGMDEKSFRYMGASIVPLFDVGDEDILFVQGNTDRLSPLVGGQSGRLRVIDGQMYTENGREITLEQNGRLKTGPRHAFESVLSHTVTCSLGTKSFEKKFGPGVVDCEGNAASASTLIEEIVSRTRLMEVKDTFVNADISTALPGPDMSPVRASVDPSEEPAPVELEATNEVEEARVSRKF